MVRIITDSAADFEPRELQQLDVILIPLIVRFGETEYQDGLDLSKADFYEKLLHSGVFPMTSQPAPSVLENMLRCAAEAGDEAVYITISAGTSGTYQSAVMAQQMAESPRCHVVDSRNATGGQRLVVEHAVRLRDAGKSAPEIVAELEAMRDNIALYACVDTLRYLYLGGRISQVSYKLGSLANIKPVSSVDVEGRVAVPAKAMGVRKGMDYLCKRVEAQTPSTRFPFYVMYTNNRSVAQTLADKIRAQGIDVPEERIIQVGAAIGAHIGPEACGLVYVAE